MPAPSGVWSNPNGVTVAIIPGGSACRSVTRDPVSRVSGAGRCLRLRGAACACATGAAPALPPQGG
eukprot:4628694-Alexandrium_andersonii.AAC.1